LARKYRNKALAMAPMKEPSLNPSQIQTALFVGSGNCNVNHMTFLLFYSHCTLLVGRGQKPRSGACVGEEVGAPARSRWRSQCCCLPVLALPASHEGHLYPRETSFLSVQGDWRRHGVLIST
jgi:hypothetical protein